MSVQKKKFVKNLKLKNRFVGFFILIKSILPIFIFLFVFLIPIKLFSPQSNKKLNNIYYYEIDVLSEHFHKITLEIDLLKVNTDKTLNELLSIKKSLERYINAKGALAENIWNKLIKDVNATQDELNKFRKIITKEIKKYILIVENMINEIKTYVGDLFEYKDQIGDFLDDMMEQLEPINDVLDFISDLDVLGVLDEIKIELPSLPSFPSFPSLNFNLLKPDFESLKEEIIAISEPLLTNFNTFKDSLNGLLTPPNFSVVVEVFNINKLKSNFLVPIYNMGSILSSYHMELNKASIMINDELLERKQRIRPWINSLMLVLLISFLFWFIVYLFNLKDNLILSFNLMRGRDVEYSIKNI